jgi:hypothetical protein
MAATEMVANPVGLAGEETALPAISAVSVMAAPYVFIDTVVDTTSDRDG